MNTKTLQLVLLTAFCSLLWASPSLAAPALTIGTVSGTAGNSVTIPVTFDPTAGNSVAAIQFSITLPSPLTAGTVTLGSAGTSASKSVSHNLATNTWTFIVYGLNQNTVASGNLLNIQVGIPAGTAAGNIDIPVFAVFYASPGAQAVTPGTSTNGRVTVQSNTPIINLNPASLVFNVTVGGANPAPQTISVNNSGAGTLTWTGTSLNPSRLFLNPSAGGNNPTTVTITYDAVGLTAGTYNPRIDFTAPGATTRTLAVTVNVVAPITISVSPTTATRGPSQTQQFTATVTGTSNTSVTWTRSPAVGSIGSTTGLYTAPASITSAQTITITATSVADPSKSATATVNLVPPVAVSISPTSVQLGPLGNQTFTANVTGSANTSVTWSMNPSLGTLTQGGVYTAPASITSNQTLTVRATSVADSTKFAQATVTLTPNANVPPAVTLTSPADGATFTSPAVITLNATASDADGTITQVEFYEGLNLLGSDTSSPYSFSWVGIPAGTYVLTARATDNNGATTGSGSATVTVSPVHQPPVAVINASPMSGAPPLAINVSGAASTSPGGTIVSYRWDFGDGTVKTGSLANHTYTSAGLYPLTLMVTNDIGDTDLAAVVIVVGQGGGLPAPSINLWPSVVPVTGSLAVGYPSGYPNVGFLWTINAATPSGSSPAGRNRAPGALGALSANFRTPTNVAALGNFNLDPGYYSITVEAEDSQGNRSAPSQGFVTLVSADFSGIRVFPNPWRSDRHTTRQVTFDNLPIESSVKIFSTAGQLVKTVALNTPSTAIWDLTNDSGDRVASGVYMYLITSKGSDGKARGKIAIIK